MVIKLTGKRLFFGSGFGSTLTGGAFCFDFGVSILMTSNILLLLICGLLTNEMKF